MYHSKELWMSLIFLGIRVINKITDPKRKTPMHNKIHPNFYIV